MCRQEGGEGRTPGPLSPGPPRELRCSPRNDPPAVLSPSVKASPSSSEENYQEPRLHSLTAASLHIVLSSGRPWSSPGLMAAAATQRSAGPMLRLSPRRLPPEPELGFLPHSGQSLPRSSERREPSPPARLGLADVVRRVCV